MLPKTEWRFLKGKDGPFMSLEMRNAETAKITRIEPVMKWIGYFSMRPESASATAIPAR